MTSRIKYNDPVQSGALSLAYHYEMLSDHARIAPFQAAIERCCKDKIVIESGTGSGVLSILAARAGAREVFAVEVDPKMAECAAENFRFSGLRNITLLQKNTLDVTLTDLRGQMAEVIIAENLSTWQVTEPELQVMNHIGRCLAATDACRLPEQILNYVELAESKYQFYDGVTIRAHYFEFSGVRKPKVLSSSTLFNTFDLRRQNVENINGHVVIQATQNGVVNSLRLSSPLIVHEDIEFSSTDSLMPPVVVPLEAALEVKAGELVKVVIEYQSNTVWEQFVARASCLARSTDQILHQ